MPRPKRKAPIATCAPRPSKTGICQPDVPVRSAKKKQGAAADKEDSWLERMPPTVSRLSERYFFIV